MRDALLSRKESQKVAEKKKSYNEMFEYQKDSVKRQYKGGADYKPEDKKNVVNMNRTPVKKVGARTVPNNAGSYVEKPQRTNEDYHSGQGEKKVARTLKYMKGKGQDGAPGLNAMISRIKDHEARRGVKKKKEKKKEEVTEASKYSSIVRAGIKLGGKKGGRLAQQGEKAALEYGKNKATQAAKGGKDAGGAEKAGAAIGGALGGLAGFAVPDGPLMAAGEIAGGYLGSKVGGAIGRKIDNRGKGQEHPQNKNTPQNNIVKTKQLKNTSKKTMGMSRQRKQTYLVQSYDVVEDMSGMSQKSGDKRSTESGAGMTAAGVAKYNRRTGGNLKTAVTGKVKRGSKAAKRRKSFCARSKGWTGERGKAARRRWKCNNSVDHMFELEHGEILNERGPQTLGSGARQSSIHAKKGKKSTKKVSGMIKSLKRKGSVLKQSMGPLDASRKALRLKNLKDDVDLKLFSIFINEGHMNKTCGEGEYYCYQSKKCKKIPKGMKIGYGGMLKPEKDDSEETKGKNGNGNGNGNGHGGNGNGNGNGGGDGGGE